ncbi:MAG: serine/threonine protein kinase [Planctomycetia bacterium]|nr:serine/threonine protein kinase [Planctomycetia bacterium]
MGDTVAYGRDLSDPSPTDAGTFEDGFSGAGALIGETIGQYRLDAMVGRGSMGRVYRAEHLGLHRPCAIKVMNPDLVSRNPMIRERFWAEARAVAHLLHPHVVTVHNLGSDRGFHYIEMEYIPGGLSLREAIIRDGPFGPVRASTLVRQVSLALQAAHKSGLVHRDVKPANVLIDSQGHAKLADFGLVRRVSELDLAGVPVAGTPTFMAPELFDGVPASHRSDLYAVGVMYYYLLSARLPFASNQISQLACLAKCPEDRYQSANALAEDLQSVIFQLRDTEGLIRESVEGLDCLIQGGRDHFRIFFRLPEDRLQEVYAEVSKAPNGERVLTIFSVCGPADSRHFEFALRLNDSLSYGSLSVRNVGGEPMFVMNRTFARDHVCAADIRAAMIEIARRSDRVEQQLTNADLY